MKIKSLFFILLASYLACILRFYLDNNFIISLLGSFFFGFVIAKRLNNEQNKILLSGFCACLTSFSGFIYVLYKFINQGFFIKAFLYTNTSILLNLISIYLGFLISRKII